MRTGRCYAPFIDVCPVGLNLIIGAASLVTIVTACHIYCVSQNTGRSVPHACDKGRKEGRKEGRKCGRGGDRESNLGRVIEAEI